MEDRAAQLGRNATAFAYVALLLLGLAQRLPLLDPPSLWYDDVWVATLVRWATAINILEYRASVPMGFVVGLKFFASFVSDPEISLQLLPMICGLLVPVALGLVVSRETGNSALGIFAAAVLILNPLAAGYSMRVKQFSWDALFVVGVLAIGLPMLRDAAGVSLRRTAVLSAVTLFSYVSALVAVPLLHLAGLRALIAAPAKYRDWPRLLAPVLAFDALVSAYYFVRLQHQSRRDTVDYWVGRGVVPEASIEGVLDYFAMGTKFGFNVALGGALPALPQFLALLAIAFSFVALFRAPTWRWRASFFALFYVEIAVAALVGVYPFGGLRTDIFSYPVTVGLVGTGLGLSLARFDVRPASRVNRFIAGGSVAVVLVCTLLGSFPPKAYLTTEDAKLVKLVEDEKRPRDLVLVSETARYAVGYYANWEMHYVQPKNRQRFYIAVSEPGVQLLEWEQQALDVSRLKGIDRVIYLDIYLTPHGLRNHHRLVSELEAVGFTQTRVESGPRGWVRFFERGAPPPYLSNALRIDEVDAAV